MYMYMYVHVYVHTTCTCKGMHLHETFKNVELLKYNDRSRDGICKLMI